MGKLFKVASRHSADFKLQKKILGSLEKKKDLLCQKANISSQHVHGYLSRTIQDLILHDLPAYVLDWPAYSPDLFY